MAHLWFRDDDNIWVVMPLNGRPVDVSVYPPRVMQEDFRLGRGAPAVLIRSSAGDPVWALVATGDADVRVNGFAPIAGLRVIQDRDEIRTALSEPLFFSTETLARVEEFAATERAIFCGRCRLPIQDKQMAVRCPKCGIWYHQMPEENSPCWTYAPNCGFCTQSTALDEGFNWVPEA
jgi:Zn finger protein HypA/HybF involved in hydrogenase expression